MRSATGLFVLVGCLAVSPGVEAKGRPAPFTCPKTDVTAAVAEMCPCAGKTPPSGSVQPWRNHGQYMSCVVRFRNALRKAGCFTDGSVRRTLARCAARSTCGKADAVICCFSDAGTCSGDPTPGDGTAAGTCSNDSRMACDASADCTKMRARIAHDEASCVADGGVSGGSTSVCGACTTTTTSTTTTTTTTTLP